MKKMIDSILLILYTLCFYTLWQLCQWGGVRSHLQRLLPLVALLLIGIIIKLILRHRGFRAPYRRARITFFVVITLYFGARIVYSAIPYHGQLSWKIQDILHHKTVEFTHSNLYTDGVDGILTDVKTKLALPEKLYISNSFSAENEKGEMETYLISYNAKHGTKLDVWTDGAAHTSFDPALLWSPLPDILSKADTEATVRSWAVADADATFEILYYGKRNFQTDEGLRFIEGDADGDGVPGTADAIYMVNAGGEVSGYEMSLYMPDHPEITPERYIMEPEYILQSALDAQHEDQIVETAQQESGWTVDQADGSVYTFAQSDANAGYRLVVTDAALGSRFYGLEKSTDAGKQWTSINADPFAGNSGVVEGIEFFTEDFGFIGLTGASGEYSSIFMTEEGGLCFAESQLPMAQITEVPDPGKC